MGAEATAKSRCNSQVEAVLLLGRDEQLSETYRTPWQDADHRDNDESNSGVIRLDNSDGSVIHLRPLQLLPTVSSERFAKCGTITQNKPEGPTKVVP